MIIGGSGINKLRKTHFDGDDMTISMTVQLYTDSDPITYILVTFSGENCTVQSQEVCSNSISIDFYAVLMFVPLYSDISGVTNIPGKNGWM